MEAEITSTGSLYSLFSDTADLGPPLGIGTGVREGFGSGECDGVLSLSRLTSDLFFALIQVFEKVSDQGNVMVCFSPCDRYVLSSAVDNEVCQERERVHY